MNLQLQSHLSQVSGWGSKKVFLPCSNFYNPCNCCTLYGTHLDNGVHCGIIAAYYEVDEVFRIMIFQNTFWFTWMLDNLLVSASRAENITFSEDVKIISE